MGRQTGHLALGIGKAAGATITLIPEEFEKETISINLVADILTGSIIKRLSMGRDHGVAIIAEGLAERMVFDMEAYDGAPEKDEMGRLRLSEIPLGEALKRIVRKRLESCGLKVTIVDKNIGYELRGADPIPFDGNTRETSATGRFVFSRAAERPAPSYPMPTTYSPCPSPNSSTNRERAR